MSDFSFVTGVTGFGIATTFLTPRTGVGMKFRNTCGTGIVMTKLGRWVLSGNNQSHQISIFNTSGVALASGMVNCSGQTTGQFVYANLVPEYTLTTGAIVYLISSELGGAPNDTWHNSNNTVLLTTSVVGNQQSAYWNGGSSFFDAGNNGGSRTSAGPVNFQYSSPDPNWTKTPNGDGTFTFNTDGTQYSVTDAIVNASAGDTVAVPAGSFTWCIGGAAMVISKAIKLMGAGAGLTTITISSDAPSGSNGAIVITAAATVGNMTINPADGSTTIFNIGTANGWRITGITYNSLNTSGGAAYFVFAATYGVIDHCTINGAGGSDEWIFTRGPTNSWQTPSSFGTTEAVYVEDCTFNVQGYTDFNSNGRAVVRFCTINPTVNSIKLDAHGYATNSPARSFRHVEFYGNNWSNTLGSSVIEIRGGTAMVFNNRNSGSANGFYLVDYTMNTNLSNLNRYATPFDYPLTDQVGVGMDPKTPHSEPAYIFNNIRTGGIWARTVQALGTASVHRTASSGFATGTMIIPITGRITAGGGVGFVGSGDAMEFSGDSNRYLVESGISSSQTFPVNIKIAAPGLLQALPASTINVISGPLTLYQYRSGDPSATFVEADVITSNRDFFADAGFDTNTGVNVGTKTQMLAYTPAVTGYGWWVTDEGSWNKTVPANTAGQLYTWSGGWSLYYTPYQYPYFWTEQRYKRLASHLKLYGLSS